MCDGSYDGDGYGDPDYYDLEFREQNPDIYGNDEYMQNYYGTSHSISNAQRSRSAKTNHKMSE